MLGFRPKLPVTEEQRRWIDAGFERLSLLLGRERLRDSVVVLPGEKHFPERYDGTEEALYILFHRICSYMRVDPETIKLEIFPDAVAHIKNVLPYYHGNTNDAAGLYMGKDGEISHMTIAVTSSKLQDPFALVPTLAHELGHAILLGGKMVDRADDMEPLTDLLTVFLGFGVFNANAAARFEQHETGWSTQRLGYLSEEMYGYALAKFASLRGERHPAWAKYLSTNVKAYYKRSRRWIKANC